MSTSYPINLYHALVANQTEGDWRHREELCFQREWAHRLIQGLDIKIKDGHYLPVPLIQIRRLRNIKTLGTYEPKPDGYGIAGTIALHEERLPEMEDYQKIALLLKLLLTAWHHQTGAGNDRRLREEAKRLGLVITEKGEITFERTGRFRRILEAHGIEAPVVSTYFPKPKRPPRATIRPWTCGCQTVYVGRGEFLGRCANPECGQEFRSVDYRD
jgi:hypothetical protein